MFLSFVLAAGVQKPHPGPSECISKVAKKSTGKRDALNPFLSLTLENVPSSLVPGSLDFEGVFNVRI